MKKLVENGLTLTPIWQSTAYKKKIYIPYIFLQTQIIFIWLYHQTKEQEEQTANSTPYWRHNPPEILINQPIDN